MPSGQVGGSVPDWGVVCARCCGGAVIEHGVEWHLKGDGDLVAVPSKDA